MMQIELQAVANQSLSVVLDGARYDVTIKEANGCMAADVSRDGVVLCRGMRVVAKTLLLPYRHLEQGNFILDTQNEEVPYFDQFGVTQYLYYLSASELEAERGT